MVDTILHRKVKFEQHDPTKEEMNSGDCFTKVIQDYTELFSDVHVYVCFIKLVLLVWLCKEQTILFGTPLIGIPDVTRQIY
jgi:hypothetical protein